MLLLLLLIGVAADSDHTDCRAGCIRNDNRLSLSLPGGTGSPVPPPTCDGGAAGGAVVHHGTARRGILLDSLGSLGGTDSLRGGHFKIGHVSGKKSKRDIKCIQFHYNCVPFAFLFLCVSNYLCYKHPCFGSPDLQKYLLQK